MALTLLIPLAALMVFTAFLSGIFGMAGGLILMGVLLYLLPLPEAMAIHAVTQMSSNGWRGLLWFRYIRWGSALTFLVGAALAFAVWSIWRAVPPKPIAFLLLGCAPFLVRLLPQDFKPNPEKLTHGVAYGGFCMSLILMAGVSGPLVDSFFLGGKLDRREIVATKSAVQILSHAAKFIYFGTLVGQSGAPDAALIVTAVIASMIGTSAARPILERLTDTQYRTYARHIITVIALAYIAEGLHLMFIART